VASIVPDLLLLIPAYNEEQRIEPVLRDYAQYFREHYHGRFQIVVVLNGCGDNTMGVVNRVAAEYPEIHALDFLDPIGKGGALIEGLKLAPTTDIIGYVDADGATAITELDRLEQAIRAGADVAIGSRSLASQRRDFTVNARWHRTVLGGSFNAIVRMGGIRGISDTQCGFKLFEKSVARDLFSVSTINGYGFDLELLGDSLEQLATLKIFANEVSVAYGIKQKLEGPADIAMEGRLVPTYTETLADYNAELKDGQDGSK
jgi:dolichyl-phosphate beta-glucosyltransferase